MSVARLVFPALRWRGRSVEEIWPEVESLVADGVGGFVVFGGTLSSMRELAARAFELTRHPVLFAADLERGAGQQLEMATPLPPAAALAGLGEAGLRTAARLTAQEAAAAGIGWILAPVADLDVEPANPIIGSRSFGADAALVADRVRSWVTAAQQEGVHACAKHFPGHGRTTLDSHTALPTVAVSRSELEADLEPFRAAVAAGVSSVMMAHVSYPALDASGAPASLSPRVVDLLRSELGFDGLVTTDAMIMESVTASSAGPEAPLVQALRAGCDVILYPPSHRKAIAALSEAASAGHLSRRRISAALERVEAAAEVIDAPRGDIEPAKSRGRALDLATASLRLLRGSVPNLQPGAAVRLTVVDDDRVALPGEVAGPGTHSPAREALEEALLKRGARPGTHDGTAPHLLAVFSDIRAWKGRANLAPETAARIRGIVQRDPAATVVLFGHPRLADQLTGAANVLCAWCGDALMQEAVAERLMSPARR